MKKDIKSYICAISVLLGCTGSALTVQAAGFDCAKAISKIEKLICADAELSKLDEELAKAYSTALQDKKRLDAIREKQKQWLRERNACPDAACVKLAYLNRLSTIRVSATHASAGTSNRSPDGGEVCLAPKIDWRNYEWILITGNDLPVCQEMLAYVKSRPKDIAPPTCPEERLPPNGNWTRPESRILNEEERQLLLRDIPERWRYKGPGSPITYEAQIRNTKLLRVIRGDITRDGLPEAFLTLGGQSDTRLSCVASKRCARPELIFKNGIVLMSDSYSILPMNDSGTNIDWSHQTVGAAGMPMGGELVFYKEVPYWMTGITWSQNTHDDFAHYSMRASDPYSKIFELSELYVNPVKRDGAALHFKDVTSIHVQRDPARNDVCRFGYFHRDNLKKNPATIRR